MVKSLFLGFLLCVFGLSARARQASERKPISDHYVASKDPSWYAKRIVPLRRQLVEIDQQTRTLRQARKDGRGTTGAVNLDNEPEGVTVEAQLQLLQQRRTEVLQRIAELEEEARRNEVSPGAMRAAEETIGENREDANEPIDLDSPEISQAMEELRQRKEHLDRAEREKDLLQRKLELDTHTVYSNPEHTAQKSGQAELTAEKNELAAKQAELRQAQQQIAALEEYLQDLRLHASRNPAEASVLVATEPKKDEGYWRRQFSEIRYRIQTAQSELAILQRELNEALLIYDPNPQVAMRESVTSNKINTHRQAIEDKKKEIAALQNQLSDLEDDLRHAGDPPGWSRE